jgi:uncharacterized protein YcsI (UPF0317 family)
VTQDHDSPPDSEHARHESRSAAAARAHDRSAAGVRALVRGGHITEHTAGLAPDFVQANIVIVPARYAGDFRRYCEANPEPCPLLAVSAPGDPSLPSLGADIDIRTDVPRYRVYRGGRVSASPTDVRDLWRDDFVTFALGCSFSFEHALARAGIPLRHVQEGKNVAMYRTSLATVPVGPFGGPLVVSMRPMRARDAIRAVELTSHMPQAHGAPVHLGDPSQIGIADIARPEFGDAVSVHAGELPVFWACGVTSQVALLRARPDLCITHAPGAMLVTDLRCTADDIAAREGSHHVITP